MIDEVTVERSLTGSIAIRKGTSQVLGLSDEAALLISQRVIALLDAKSEDCVLVFLQQAGSWISCADLIKAHFPNVRGQDYDRERYAFMGQLRVLVKQGRAEERHVTTPTKRLEWRSV